MRATRPGTARRWTIRAARPIAFALGLTAWLIWTATPVPAARSADPTPVDPVLCRVDPRPLPLWDGTPAADDHATAPDPADGEPSDDATVRGITGTIVESIACANAGQTLRALALVTHDFLARQFTGPGAADVTESGALLSRPESTPLSFDQLALISIENAVDFSDGSVGAVVVTANAEETHRDYVVFVEGQDRWLIDASFPLDTEPATPTAG